MRPPDAGVEGRAAGAAEISVWGGGGRGIGGAGGPMWSDVSEREIDASDFWRRMEEDRAHGFTSIIDEGDCEYDGVVDEGGSGMGELLLRPKGNSASE
jgi:hypothetical protein